jgi:hypothetical protein
MGVVLALVVACQAAAPPAPTTAPAQPTSAPAQAAKLSQVCPNPLVIQMNFLPEAVRGGLIGLIDPAKGTVDPKKAAYIGPAVADPNLTVEVRAGGPAAGNQDALTLMIQNPEVLIADTNMDQMIQQSQALPTVGIMAPLAKHPQIFMWNPQEYKFKSLEEIRDSGAVVLVSGNAIYADVLIGKGLLKKEQVDYSYNFSPARFVAENGKIVQQGFATSEPFLYENVVKDWKKPVEYLLIADSGYENYANVLAVRAADVTAKAECFKALVPVIQKSYLDFVANPDAVKAKIVEFSKGINAPAPQTPEGVDFAIKVMREKGIVSNGADSSYGDFDMARVQRFITDIIPVFTAKGSSKHNPNLKAENLVTNQFINTALGLPPQ